MWGCVLLDLFVYLRSTSPSAMLEFAVYMPYKVLGRYAKIILNCLIGLGAKQNKREYEFLTGKKSLQEDSL